MVKRMRSFFAVVMLVIAAAVNAQVTTSSMSGKVVDQSNEAIIGATIQAIHEPSGTHYGAITNVDGRYSIQYCSFSARPSCLPNSTVDSASGRDISIENPLKKIGGEHESKTALGRENLHGISLAAAPLRERQARPTH